MSLPVSPLTPVSDIQSAPSTPVNNASNNTGSNNDGSRQDQHQMPPPAPTATTTQMKRKPSRRANTAERRATHNAVERQRRETLNGRFLDLASLLPNLSQIRRPSKSSIVNSSIAYIHASRRHHLLASRELRLLRSETDHLRLEINEWRDRAGLMRMEEPVRSEGFGVVISGQMEVVQATVKPGSGSGGSGRGRRGRGDGEEGDEDEDDGEEGEGEDGMIGLGGYGGSYMDDVEEEIILDGGVAPPSLQPVVEEFMPPPSSMHVHHQQQQMAINAAIHGSPLEDMDDARIANLLLKNGNNGFSQPSSFGFQQQQEQVAYNPHQQYQQPTFSSSYLPDKLWNDHQQYPAPHLHRMMQQQQQQEQASRSLFNPPESLQQYHQPTLSVNTGVGMVEITNDVMGKSSIRGMAIKTKIANAKASARVKASSNGHSHPHSHAGSSPSHSTHDDSPISATGIIRGNGGSPIQISSPPASSSLTNAHRHHHHHHYDNNRSGSRSGSESGSTSSSSCSSSPSYELHSQGDYVNGGGIPRRGSGMDHVVGFMNGMGLGMNMPGRGGGMNMGSVNMTGIPGMGYGGPGHVNSNEMMMLMM